MGERATIAEMAETHVRSFLDEVRRRVEMSAPGSVTTKVVAAKLAEMGFRNRLGNLYTAEAVRSWFHPDDRGLPSDVMFGLAAAYGIDLSPGIRDLGAELDAIRERLDVMVCVVEEIGPELGIDLAARLRGTRSPDRQTATA